MRTQQGPPQPPEVSGVHPSHGVEDEPDFLGQLAQKLAVPREVAQKMLGRSLVRGSSSRRAARLLRLEQANRESEPQQ